MTPFDRNQSTVPPDYSPPAEIARNKVRQALPTDDLLATRNFPDGNRLAQHCRVAERTFARVGTGPLEFPIPGLNPDGLYANGIATNGYPEVRQLTPGTSPADYVCDAAKLIADIAADQTPGLSTLEVGGIFHGHWSGKTTNVDDKLTLTADRGTDNGVALSASVVNAVIALARSGDPDGQKTYANYISGVHRALTGGA